MPQDLSLAEGHTIPSLPPWARSFVMAEVDGRPVARWALTDQHKAEILAALRTCDRRMIPASAEQVLTQIAKLLLAFPSQELSETAARYRSEGYLTALSEFPAWAVAKGCEAWLRRRSPEGNENYAFAPSPPQLVRLCGMELLALKTRRAELQRLLEAKPWTEVTPEQGLRRAEKARQASAKIGAQAGLLPDLGTTWTFPIFSFATRGRHEPDDGDPLEIQSRTKPPERRGGRG